MSRLSSLTVAAVLVTAATAATAIAKPALSCRILTDDRTDETPLDAVAHPVDRPNLDVVSGDVATDATRMTVVGRVRALPAPVQGEATELEMYIAIGESEFRVVAIDGYEATLGRVLTYHVTGGSVASGSPISYPPVVVDRAHAELRVTFPLSVLAPYVQVKRGTTIRLFDIDSIARYGSEAVDTYAGPMNERVATSMGVSWDRGDSGPQRYVAGNRSCVTVGK